MEEGSEKPKLFIVATPIGNLGDITLRALEVLRAADLILCEDTRVTRRLLDRYEIASPTLSYHQHSRLSKIDKILAELEKGKSLALVTDAGTPGISDPGNQLVAQVLEKLGSAVEVVPIPGPSAITCLASVAGVDLSRFCFWGFPPHKKGRETFFQNILSQKNPAIYYDSPHRIQKNLELLRRLAEDKKIELIIGNELTKMFEKVIRGDLEKILNYFEKEKKIRGEFVVLVMKMK